MSKNNPTTTLPVVGMHCASCASTIKRKLEKIEGIESCTVNYGTEQVQLKFDPAQVTVQQMNEHLEPLGYSLEAATTSSMSDMSEHHLPQGLHGDHDMMTPLTSDASVKARKVKELEQLKKQIQVVVPMVALTLLIMSWEIGSNSLKLWSEMPPVVMDFVHHLLPLLASYMLFVIGLPYLKAVFRFVKFRVANMDTLVGIGTLVAFLYSFGVSAFEEILQTVINTQQSYYDVTIVVIGFITLGKYLEAKSKLKTGEAIEKLLGLQPKTAILLKNNQQIEIPIEQVQVGDVLVIKPGQKIPVDSKVLKGSSAVDESMITGEALPVDKKAGDTVIGATINKQGSLEVRATKVGQDTVLAQIIKIVETAQGSKAPIERLADQVSAIFVPIVLVLAVIVLLAWILIGMQFMPISQAITMGLVSMVGVLVIACPCAMGLATPTAVIVGVGKAAQSGILIKNAESLEKFTQINYIVLDKTGTVTQGKPQVMDIVPQGAESETTVLSLLASLENFSEHPLARAILEQAKAKKISLLSVEHFMALEGKGVKGVVEKKEYFAGNLRLAQELNLSVDKALLAQFTSQGKTPILLMTTKKVLAYVAIGDAIKKDVSQVIQDLHNQQMKVAILTGDAQQTAEYIAQKIGIDQVIAEVLPAEKADHIKKLQKQGYKVAMVGDGINDAPALATADVGIAMGTGTDVAIETAGITLLGGQLSKLPKAIFLARSTMKTIKQNLFWAFFYNVISIPVAAGLLYPFWGILLSPALAGAAMAFSSVSVVLNALRLKTIKI